MKPHDSADKVAPCGWMQRLVRFLDCFFDHLSWDGLFLGALAGLVSIALMTLCHGCHKGLVENHVVRKSNAACARLSEECRKLVLQNKITNVRLVKWMGASTSNNDVRKSFNVAVIVKEAHASSLHRPKSSNERVVATGRHLRDVSFRNIGNELLSVFELAEYCSKDGRNQKGDHTNEDASRIVGSSISKYHIHSLAND